MQLPDALGEMAALLAIAAGSMRNLLDSHQENEQASQYDGLVNEVTRIAARLQQIGDEMASAG